MNIYIFSVTKQIFLGIISDYFKPRWEIFFKAMSEYLVEGVKFDKKKVKLDMFTKAEEPFTLDNKEYPTTENGKLLVCNKT